MTGMYEAQKSEFLLALSTALLCIYNGKLTHSVLFKEPTRHDTAKAGGVVFTTFIDTAKEALDNAEDGALVSVFEGLRPSAIERVHKYVEESVRAEATNEINVIFNTAISLVETEDVIRLLDDEVPTPTISRPLSPRGQQMNGASR